MLVRLMPDQISRNWEVLKYAIDNSLPPIAEQGPDKMNLILENLINGTMQAWVNYSPNQGNGAEVRIETIAITTIAEDGCSGVKSLLIYCLYSFNPAPLKAWIEGYDTFKKFAKGIGCSRIIAYTNVDKLKELAKRLGGDTEYTFVSMPV